MITVKHEEKEIKGKKVKWMGKKRNVWNKLKGNKLYGTWKKEKRNRNESQEPKGKGREGKGRKVKERGGNRPKEIKIIWKASEVETV